MEKKTCCFSGLKPNKLHYGFDENHPDCLCLKVMLALEIQALINKGVTTFLTGMVDGPDIWCAELVLDLKRKSGNREIKLIAYLPYEEQATYWNKEKRERNFNILAKADDFIMQQTSYTSDCLYKHKRYLIDASSHLIAVHDGKKGDIQFTINYAKKKGLDIVTIHPATLTRNQFSNQICFY